MPHRSSFPARVLAIAFVILVGVSLLLIAVNRLGRPAQPPATPTPAAETPAEPPGTSTAPGAPGGGAAANGEGADAAAPAGSTGDASSRDAALTEQVTVQLYLIDVATHELVPRYRRVQAPPTTAARAQVALEELVRAGGLDVVSPLPPQTVIREVWVSASGIAYVDLAEGFPKLLEQGSMAEIHAVYGMIGTLTASFPEIRMVQFLVEEEPVDTFTGHLDLSTPLGPLSDWLYR